MSYDYPAVQLGAADSRIASGQEAHDAMHDDDDDDDVRGRQPFPEAIQAMKATSLVLESTLHSSDDLNSHPLPLRDLRDSSRDATAVENHDGPFVTETKTVYDATKQLVIGANGIHEPYQGKLAPSSGLSAHLSLLPRDTTSPTTPPSPSTTKTTIKVPPFVAAGPHTLKESGNILPALREPQNSATGSSNIPHEGNMRFGTIGAVSSASHRRRQYANTSVLTDYEADLTGKDRAKQKEAVKRFLTENIQDDWKWEWPLPNTQPAVESGPVAFPGMPVDTEDLPEDIIEEHWKEREEWISDVSENGEIVTAIIAEEVPTSDAQENEFRFESPDGVGETIKKTQIKRKQQRKRRLAEEMAHNDGLRCFVQRRDAWTGARHVRSARLGSLPIEKLQKSTSHSSEDEGSSTAIDADISDVEDEWEADTEILVAPPLIPPTNAMRASITPTAYNTIYDKVILQQLTPSCPINLKDITRSCVQGWKRDGEWPPRSSVPEALAGRRRRKLSMASLFGLELTKSKEDKEKLEKEKAERETREAEMKSGERRPSGIKRRLQKLLLLGKDRDKDHVTEIGNASNGSNGKAKELAIPPTI